MRCTGKDPVTMNCTKPSTSSLPSIQPRIIQRPSNRLQRTGRLGSPDRLTEADCADKIFTENNNLHLVGVGVLGRLCQRQDSCTGAADTAGLTGLQPGHTHGRDCPDHFIEIAHGWRGPGSSLWHSAPSKAFVHSSYISGTLHFTRFK